MRRSNRQLHSFAARLIALLCALALLAGCTPNPPAAGEDSAFFTRMQTALSERGGYTLRAAVLYDESGAGHWQTLLGYLKQPLLVGLTAEAADAYGDWESAGYDLLYVDESVANGREDPALAEKIVRFAENGGAVFCLNALASFLPAEAFGATGFAPVDAYPERIRQDRADADSQPMQQIISDFHALYARFQTFETLRAMDYGLAAKGASDSALISVGGRALYTLSDCGAGCVFLASPLLPNFYTASACSMQPEDEEQTPFAPTAASFNRLLLSAFASYAAKRIYGCALERVFGCNGSPAMAWELHYEELDAIGNGALYQFADICESRRQIPSFTVVRNPYQWFTQTETVSYLLNQSGAADTLAFQMDLNENAYSSGTHADSGGAWLRLSDLTGAGSYFDTLPAENVRLSPCAYDYDGDGDLDLFCGSSDGCVYYFENLGFTGLDGRLRFGEKQQIISAGEDVTFSAPAVMDVNGDGRGDLVVGTSDGVLRWYRGGAGLYFAPHGTLLDTGYAAQALPAAADFDLDGVTDLVVGSPTGRLTLYRGEQGTLWRAGETVSLETAEPFAGQLDDFGWAAPSAADVNADGKPDLVLGCFEGYTDVYPGDGAGAFGAPQRVTTDELNYKGNNSVKLGTYLTPLLLDLDGDGDLDLLGGYEEYGMAYPIDSPYFPYRDELQKQIDYCRGRGWYVSAHSLTTAYSSEAREQYEFAAHKKALLSYGLDVTGLGTNQHTWFVSWLDGAQTLRAQREAGYLWNSGLSPANDLKRTPQTQAENIVVLPYYLDDGGTPFLVQNVSVLPYLGTDDLAVTARYGSPVCAYYHCDLIFRKGPENYERDVGKVEDFRRAYGYNFVREDQLMKSTAAAMDLTLGVSSVLGEIVLTPGAQSEELPLYDARYQSACGVRIDFAAEYDASQIATDARVLLRGDHSLTVALDGDVTLRGGAADDTPIRRVNLPASISMDESGAEIAFRDGGLMEVCVSGEAAADDDSWSCEQRENETIFTKFGDADTLRITFSGD